MLYYGATRFTIITVRYCYCRETALTSVTELTMCILIIYNARLQFALTLGKILYYVATMFIIITARLQLSTKRQTEFWQKSNTLLIIEKNLLML